MNPWLERELYYKSGDKFSMPGLVSLMLIAAKRSRRGFPLFTAFVLRYVNDAAREGSMGLISFDLIGIERTNGVHLQLPSSPSDADRIQVQT